MFSERSNLLALVRSCVRDGLVQDEAGNNVCTGDLDVSPLMGVVGLSSLGAMSLRNDIQDKAGVSLPKTLVFDFPTITAIVDKIEGDVLAIPQDRLDSCVTVGGSGCALAVAVGNMAIAISSDACRSPGAVQDAAHTWWMLGHGMDAILSVPTTRWDNTVYYESNPDAPGKTCSRHMGIVDGVEYFDADVFGISKEEAIWTDPQQRILLEVCWESMSGVRCSQESTSDTITCIGFTNTDYAAMVANSHAAKSSVFAAAGTAASIAAGRVSYTLGLKGSAVTIDSACSSSLVAVDFALTQMRVFGCSFALCGGVNLVLTPHSTVAISRLQMRSPDGRCNTFDSSANGYVRADGCGIALLRPLPDSDACRGNVLAGIRNSATNQDGKSSSLTAPCGPSQTPCTLR